MKLQFIDNRYFDAGLGALAGANPYAAGAEAVIGIGEAAYGLIQGGKLKKEAEQLQKERPKYNINPFARQDVSFAESELSRGMGSEAEQAYNEGIDKDLSTSLSASLKSGAGVNMAGDLFGSSSQARQKLAMMREQTRLNQTQNVIASHQYYNEQADKAFMYNVDAPWKDAVRANAAARQQTSNMVQSGINTLGSAAVQYGSEVDKATEYDRYFKGSGGTPLPSPQGTQQNPPLVSDFMD